MGQQTEDLRNQALIKSMNRAKILNAIRLHSPIARAQIADMTGLDRKSLTNFVKEFLKEGLVEEIGVRPQDGMGRPFTMLDFRRRLAMGIEVEPAKVSGIMLDLYGRPQGSASIEDRRIASSTKILLSALKRLYEKLSSQAGPCIGVGVAVPGAIDPLEGKVVGSVNIPSAETELKARLSSLIEAPVYVEGSSQAAALAEKWFGAGKGAEDFVFVEIGVGVGSGIVSGRRIYRGAGMHAGEIGHTIIERNGRLCRCGKKGCVEAYASESRILDEARRIFGRGFERVSEIGDASGTGLEETLKDAGKRIGWALANVLNLYNPKLIIAGGTLIDAFGGIIMPAIMEGASEGTLPVCMKDVRIISSSLESPIAKGAASLALSPLFEVDGYHYV